MSSTFQAVCPLHEVKGPRIHRTGGNVWLWPNPDKPGQNFFTDPNSDERIRNEWNAWLLMHEFCDFVIERYS